MPVQVGAPVHSFSDPTGLLSDCHRRIEMFLGALQSVAPFLAEPPNAGLVSMYRSHIAFEEEVVFPCAAEILSAKDKAAIAGEMASRRNL